MKKGTKIAIGIGLLVGVAVVGYFIWKTVSEKAGSKSANETSVQPTSPNRKLGTEIKIRNLIKDKITKI